MKEINYNPDVLTCLANLSNDEVFTPPSIVNQMLDTLPKELWSDSKAKFLDPFSKSGVFLREIVKRLNVGLEKEIPNLQDRINHILKNQVYGIAITELTALLTRRSLYCSKYANGKKSITNIFKNEDGNIAYERIEHTFENGKCKYCGASEDIYDRGEELESHAYIFIHNKNPYKNMQFDVIIGNPPYQLSDGSGASSDAASPIYNKFIEEAIKLSPKFIIMITPSKWMVGGRGLNKFREKMLNEKHLKYIYDYENASDCFPGLHIDGGVNYFLWDRDFNGKTNYTYKSNNGVITKTIKYLKNDYFDYIIRDNRILSILEKIKSEDKLSSIISNTKPFGIRKYLFNEPERYPDAKLKFNYYPNSVKIYGVKGIKGGAKRIIGYINKESITNNIESINKYKLFFTTSYSTNAIEPPEIIIAEPNEVCTETFLMVGPFKFKKEQMNCYSFMQTNFFKTLLYFGKGTMQVNKNVFGLVPMQDFNEEWNDEKLYKKYGLSQEEIDFIESMIRPME
ncbi:MAG: Eco57I restriction-modification methylase domain-containing protein [Bacteroidales bacterium]|nr:Eco57I restriction-modification methylase domain-containing protein [Bacteroidales bacterium]